jgi:class 3 adenylate cyclase/FixJ family two-component response regulator
MTHRILIVDDEPDLQILISQKFRSKIRQGDYHFEYALNGAEALAKLIADDSLRIMLTDINMPIMDGLTLLNRINENQLELKTVVVSAYGDISNIRTAMNRGAFDFVVKPIDMNDLETTMNKAINEHQIYMQGKEAKVQLIETLKEKEVALLEKNAAQEHVIELMADKEKMILQQNEILEQKVIERTSELVAEKKKSDDLLLNILPAETADELKQKGSAEAKYFENVTVMFTDFVNFTSISETLTAKELVKQLNYYFINFDNLITEFGLEKIKTVGDGYIAACGLPIEDPNHAVNVAKAALAISKFVRSYKAHCTANNLPFFDVRIGLNSGPVVAGIVGIKKFAFDIWGDTVNTAARMEQTSEPGKINISGTTFNLIKDQFVCAYRGKMQAKNKGEIDMYFLESSL